MRNPNKPKKKKSLTAKFFTVVFSILLIYFLALGAYVGYTYLNSDGEDDYFKVNGNLLPAALNVLPKVPERTNVLLLGVDEDLTRTDTIMVASFNSVSKEVSLLSIPRDTLVTIPDERWEVMCENISQLKGYNYHEIKMNAVHHYAGENHGIEYVELQLEEMLDIEIDYYARINCEAFRYIIDSVGGIEYDVPMRMKYSDPTQNLSIDLQPGLQTLDGDKAEQLVRFRSGYLRADLERVEVQRDFLKVLISTVLDKDNIMSNPTAYLSTIIKYVDTNMKVTDAIKYVKYLSGFSSSNVIGYTLPGEPQNLSGGSYYIIDEDKTEEMVYDIFKKPTTAPEDIVIEDSFNKEIQILNGGYTSGLAGKKQEMLEELGYTVSDIGDYNGSKSEQTKIYVKKEGQGQDIAKYFNDAKIMIDDSKLDEYDIVVILGTEETEDIPEISSETSSQE